MTNSDDIDESVSAATTHSEWGAGHPRLLISGPDGRLDFDLTDDLVTIGSGADAQLVLAGTKPLHAEVRHQPDDEYLLVLHAEAETPIEPTPLDPAGNDGALVLRTGARFTLGDWALVFQRDEFADHGRPYGGRQGGELDDQPEQPPRPVYDGTDGDSSDGDGEK